MLARLSRVCRLWHEALIPLLYRAPQIMSLLQAEILYTCIMRKDFVRMVRSLTWTPTPYLDFPTVSLPRNLIQICPNLEEIFFWLHEWPLVHVGNHFLQVIHGCHHQLKKLALQKFGPWIDEHIIKIALRFPLLEILDLTGTPIKLQTAHRLLRICKRLTELIFVDFHRPGKMAKIERARPPRLTIRYTPRA
ncbi:hypothetical protein DFS34DRAFT_634427 [Phlyctochytrium arcticum]|nr:hypothetical protein DFS34DRAFT_634427 [Phlyctochytrium arcticum]